MTDNKPGRRTFLILGLIFIATVGSVIYIVQYRTNRIVTELTLNRIQASNQSFLNFYSELEVRALRRAEVISRNEGIIASINSSDTEALRRTLFSIILGLDFASICDSSGIVLARSHSIMTGDNISGYKAVSSALNTGLPSTSCELVESNGMRLSLYASVPIYEYGRIIGIINCHYDLTRSEHLDDFKEQTGFEASVFFLDEQISTTITDKFGNRNIGARAPVQIINTVFNQRKEYIGNFDLYESTYGGCYSPLLVDGETIGMLFAGVNIHSILENRRSMNRWIYLASLVGIAASVAFMIFSNNVAQKYARLAEKQLRQQMLMADISRSFLSDTDINTLIAATLQMIGKFMNLSRLLLFMLDDDGVTLTCRDEWMDSRPERESYRGRKLQLKEPILSMMKNLVQGAGKESCLNSDNPETNKLMTPYRKNFKSFIITPIFVKGKMTGAIDYSKAGTNRQWNDSEISLAMLFASTLSGVFEREGMERQISIVENSPHMIFYSDREGNLEYANPAATGYTGYNLNELRAGGFGLLFDREAVKKIKENYIPMTLQKGVDHEEITLICKDGLQRPLEMTSFVMQNGMVAGIAVDLTEIRAMESKLIEERDRADQASHAKSEFLSNMSHEMRTPMNAIIGMTAIAKRAADKTQVDHALNKVEEASTHLLGIINDILDMMKIEAKKLELSNVEFDLRNSLAKAVSIVQFRMEEKNQRFVLNVDNEVPSFLLGDDHRLKQVIINLLSNAVKFTEAGGEIKLNVSLISENDGICELRFEVADTGIGMSPEQQTKLFRMFQQAETGITRKYGGTGLGLVISKRIVELMDGNIYVESEKGKGSKFVFTAKMTHIFRDSLADPEADDANVNEKPEDYTDSKFEGKKLLLAEDIEINREILISLLDGLGLIIDTAENGKEALEKVKNNSGAYDLVLMDMQMPEIDGLEATRRIRALDMERSKTIPIIAMTANVFKDDIENCLAAGMDDHIGKPLDLTLVLEKLRKYL